MPLYSQIMVHDFTACKVFTCVVLRNVKQRSLTSPSSDKAKVTCGKTFRILLGLIWSKPYCDPMLLEMHQYEQILKFVFSDKQSLAASKAGLQQGLAMSTRVASGYNTAVNSFWFCGFWNVVARS